MSAVISCQARTYEAMELNETPGEHLEESVEGISRIPTRPAEPAVHINRPRGDHLSDPDADLVSSVQTGDVQAFDELIARHTRRVYQTVVAIVANVDEAQDATQDTFLKAFQHIGKFRGQSKFSTWLTSIASNTAIQRLREQRPSQQLEESDDAEFRCRQIRAWEADPEESCSLTERRRLVEGELMRLPSKYRAAIFLRDIEQLSTTEAAAALGLGSTALKARLFRARLMLRQALSPHLARPTREIGR